MKLIKRWFHLKWIRLYIWICEREIASNKANGINEELVKKLERKVSDLKATMREFDL